MKPFFLFVLLLVKYLVVLIISWSILACNRAEVVLVVPSLLR